MSAAEIVPARAQQRVTAPITFRRALAMLLLPASMLPVTLFGPALLRAPRHLWREAAAWVQRLEEPAGYRSPRRPVTARPTPARAQADHSAKGSAR